MQLRIVQNTATRSTIGIIFFSYFSLAIYFMNDSCNVDY